MLRVVGTLQDKAQAKFLTSYIQPLQAEVLQGKVVAGVSAVNDDCQGLYLDNLNSSSLVHRCNKVQ